MSHSLSSKVLEHSFPTQRFDELINLKYQPCSRHEFGSAASHNLSKLQSNKVLNILLSLVSLFVTTLGALTKRRDWSSLLSSSTCLETAKKLRQILLSNPQHPFTPFLMAAIFRSLSPPIPVHRAQSGRQHLIQA